MQTWLGVSEMNNGWCWGMGNGKAGRYLKREYFTVEDLYVLLEFEVYRVESRP